MKFWPPVLLATTLAIQAAPPVVPVVTEPWTETRTAHFHIYSNLTRSETLDMARDFEGFHAAIQLLLGTGDADPGPVRPVRIYLFRDKKHFSRAAAQKNWAGFFQEGLGSFNMALLGRTPTALETAFHEYFHYHANRVTGGHLPLWVNEGLACFFQTATLEKDSIRIGTPSLERLRRAFSRPRLTLRELHGVKHGSPFYSGPNEDLIHTFYSSAWFAVHYLQMGAPERKGQLSAFVGHLKAGLSFDQAVLQAFDTTPEGLDRDLAEYQRKSRVTLPAALYTFRDDLKIPTEMTHRPLSQAEALSTLGMLNLTRVQEGDPQAHFDAALALDPNCAPALIGKALLQAFRTGRQLEIPLERLQQAVASDPSPMNHYLLGLALLTSRTDSNLVGTHLLAAARAQVGDAHSVVALAARADDLSPAHRGELIALARQYPAWGALRTRLAAALWQTEDSETGLALAREDARSPDPATAQAARDLLEREAKRQAVLQEAAAAAAPQPDPETEAVALARQAVKAVGDKQDAKALEYVQAARRLKVSEELARRLEDLEAQIRKLPKPKPPIRKKR